MTVTHQHDSLRPEVIRARVTDIAPRLYVAKQTIPVESYNTNVLKYLTYTDRGVVKYLAESTWPDSDEVVYTKNTAAEILRFGGKFTLRWSDIAYGTIDNIVARNTSRLTEKIVRFEDELITAQWEASSTAAGANKVVATTKQWPTSANIISTVTEIIDLVGTDGYKLTDMIVNPTSYRYLLQGVTATSSDRALSYIESGVLSQYQGLNLLETTAKTFGNADQTNDDVFVVARGQYGFMAESEPLQTEGPYPIMGSEKLSGVYVCGWQATLPVVDISDAIGIIQDVF